MYAKIRLVAYISAAVLAVAVFFLVLFGVVSSEEVVGALPILALVYGSLLGLAAKNVNLKE